MADVPAWVTVLFLACGACLQIPAGLLVDQLLKYQYRYHPDSWDAEGRRAGFLWRPRDAESILDSIGQPWPAEYRWLWRTPDWIRENPDCLAKLNVLRVIEGFTFLVGGAWILIVVLL